MADYAETRPDRMARLIADLVSQPPRHPVRLLLLTRHKGAWWEGLRTELPHVVSEDPLLAPLSPLAAEPAERAGWFDEAIAAFTSPTALPALPDAATVDWPTIAARLRDRRPDLTDDRYGNVLTLHMAALVALLRAAAGDDPAQVGDPERELVAHERRYQRRIAARRGLFNPGVLSSRHDVDERRRDATGLLDRAVAGAILLGACDNPTAAAVAGLAGGPVHDVLAWLGSLYPPTVGSPTAIGLVQPDRLAERMLAQTLMEQPDVLPAASVLLDQQPAIVNALTVVSRAAERPDHHQQLTEQIASLIDAHPARYAPAAQYAAVAVTHPAGLLAGLHRYGQRDLPGLVATLNLVAARLPRYSVSLAGYITQITALHVTVLRELTDDEHTLPDLAMSVNNHALRLAEAGRRSEALTFSQEAVTLRRELAEANRDAYLPDLAVSVNNHALRLAEAGRRSEALTFSQEAVTVYRELAEANRDAYLPDLAASVNNHANRLAEAGRRSEALTFSQEAVTVYRELAEANRDAYLPNLAMSVNNHANRLAEAGRRSEALTFSQEAVTVYRELAEANRDAYLPNLAMSVNNHANRLAEAGRRPEALTFSQEAVTLRRELAEANRDAYLPDLARGLWVAAWVRHALNADLDNGLALIAEAVSLFVALVEHEPEAFIGLLRAALATQADILQALDRTAEADEIRTLLNPPPDRS
ncbi:tetratricopeptide repeat protein [Solwaraspora sp. WMMD1047]|uniref:tetratricopeptide repeat protein n=1 Tax=Solwaraspora sp. WMMD1047 TaxID=3016102 RepID=UPI0024174BFA|nr:tetratricopeptide repeat protein [Solwaraspora sp. WMMD1047]MDG4834817.1 tetratricopeptide repeat protein [Solwaraspora sp. WMMD1047]